MTRFTATEQAALASARGFHPDLDLVALTREARDLRAEVLSEMFGGGLRRIGAALGLPALSQRLAQRRLYRRTLAELSRLDARALQDIGINRGEILRTAREAAGLSAEPKPGLFARLGQAMADARQRRRAAQDLALLDPRLLLDIGVEPDGIEHYVEEARRYGHRPQPVLVTATPAIALDLLFPAGRRTAQRWTGEPRPAANQAANQAAETARAA